MNTGIYCGVVFHVSKKLDCLYYTIVPFEDIAYCAVNNETRKLELSDEDINMQEVNVIWIIPW